jgi:hypothetical protein
MFDGIFKDKVGARYILAAKLKPPRPNETFKSASDDYYLRWFNAVVVAGPGGKNDVLLYEGNGRKFLLRNPPKLPSRQGGDYRYDVEGLENIASWDLLRVAGPGTVQFHVPTYQRQGSMPALVSADWSGDAHPDRLPDMWKAVNRELSRRSLDNRAQFLAEHLFDSIFGERSKGKRFHALVKAWGKAWRINPTAPGYNGAADMFSDILREPVKTRYILAAQQKEPRPNGNTGDTVPDSVHLRWFTAEVVPGQNGRKNVKLVDGDGREFLITNPPNIPTAEHPDYQYNVPGLENIKSWSRLRVNLERYSAA